MILLKLMLILIVGVIITGTIKQFVELFKYLFPNKKTRIIYSVLMLLATVVIIYGIFYIINIIFMVIIHVLNL